MRRLNIGDMDGVFADFPTAACEVHGRDATVDKWNFFEDWGVTEAEFWAPIHALGDDFYGEVVKPYPWCGELLELLKSFGEFRIMSAPGIGEPEDYAGKPIWCRKYLPGVKPIAGYEKWIAAGPNRVLIDDSERNCKDFESEGGSSICFPQPWNFNFDRIGDRIAHVRNRLELLTYPHQVGVAS